MSFGVQGSFKFTWVLEDMYTWFAHRDFVRSPFFTSEKVLKKTSWCIYLHGSKESMREGSLCLNLSRRDSIPGKIKLYVSMFLVMPDDTLQMVDKQMKCVCESGERVQFNLGYSFHTLRELFYGDKIKILCEIVNPSTLVILPEQFTARTRLGTEIINCLWKIQSFLSFAAFNSPFPLTHDASHRLEIKGISWERNALLSLPSADECLNIKIGTVDENIESSAHVEGEISLLNAEKEIVLSIDSKHIFLSGSDKKSWNFVIPFSRKDIVEACDVHRTNEELSLLCKFTFYTTVNESLEYTILPRSCRNMASKSAARNPESNFSAVLVKGFRNLNVDGDKRDHVEEEKLPKNLIEDITDLYRRENYCDVVLKAGTQSFPSHKTILCARSPVFKDMFDEDLRKRKSEEVFIDLDADTMRQFLLFLYSENLDNLQWESAKKLLHAANKFQVESLQTKCCSFLKSQFCLSNVCEALSIAYMYQDYDLRRECEKFIFPNASEVFSSTEWKVFALKNPSFSSDIIKRYFSLKK
ncbi:Protein roadkill [Araneus ventricosus]|uniref:Protein roadkill n=1 Tax=Araneus ventricosus TaxID=182803 RepID=A0A4Y2EIV3_ARAVE|nr:Protein roadkill [Araneus ventricosus]